MKLQPFIQKLNSSSQYKEFMGKYPDAFLVAGFFILDLEAGQNLQQIDYYLPKEKKVAAFTLADEIKVQVLETMGGSMPEKLESKTKIDLDALEGILEDEMKNRSITEEIKKIIAVLQTIKGKKIWNLNCVLSGMGILRAHIEDDSKSVLKMEKISMMDIMKHIPKQMLGKVGAVQGEAVQGEEQNEEEQIKKLDKLKESIEKQEEQIREQARKKKSVKAEKN